MLALNRYQPMVQVIRAAFKDIQKLPHQYFEDVAQIISNISLGNFGDHRKLQGYQDLWRTRKGDIRVIWERINQRVLIIKAGQRNNVYEGVIEDRDRSNLLNLSDILQIEPEKINDIPAYKWINDQQSSWHQFVFGDYLYSPVLTAQQREVFVFNELTSLNFNQNYNTVPSFLLQSSPGTGKTICAALMACQLYNLNNDWNVFLILPKALRKEVREFTDIKEILQQQPDNFFVGTFNEWFQQVAPTIYAEVASKAEELAALQQEARRSHAIQRNDTFSEQDLILYRSFVSSKKNNESKHPNYLDNRRRIQQLAKIKEERWRRTLNHQNKICWLDGIEKLTNNLIPDSQIFQRERTLFIFDETQDYLLDELNAIKNMLSRWQEECGHYSILWLLGDMNQRIKPVNFDWGQLHLNERYSLKYNYRNTQKILEFANIFHGFARAINSELNHRAKHLPEPCNPNDAFEKGEPVKILEVSSTDEAQEFLEKLNTKITSSSINSSERSLLRKLSIKVSLIHTASPESYQNYRGIESLTIDKAKGREFDACIAFCVFQGQGQLSYQESNNLYTLFTRPRHRLLVVATSKEINRIQRENFQQCEFFDSSDTEELIKWVAEYSNSEQLFRDINAVCKLIYEGLMSEPIQIYWDTYVALRLTQADDDQIEEIEGNIIEKLRCQSDEILQQELEQTKNISDTIDRVPLRCLILSSLGKSWEAVSEASQIKDLKPQEYKRLLNVIANELENKGLFYEAARVRTKIGESFPRDYPFSDYFQHCNQQDSLVSILCKSAIDTISISSHT